MHKEIPKSQFTQVILALIELNYDMSKNSHIDDNTKALVRNTIDMLRYYRQFAE